MVYKSKKEDNHNHFKLNMCYLGTTNIFLPMIILQIEFGYYFVANGKPTLGLISSIIGGTINVILDIILTKYLHFGITSISIASGIGYTVGVMIGLIYFKLNKKNNLYLVEPKLDNKVLIKTLTNGCSGMVTNISSSITTILFNTIMLKYLGVNAVSAIGTIIFSVYI